MRDWPVVYFCHSDHGKYELAERRGSHLAKERTKPAACMRDTIKMLLVAHEISFFFSLCARLPLFPPLKFNNERTLFFYLYKRMPKKRCSPSPPSRSEQIHTTRSIQIKMPRELLFFSFFALCARHRRRGDQQHKRKKSSKNNIK